MQQPSSPQPRLILFGEANRKRLLQGVRVFSRAVTVTYGPHGNIVLLDRMAGLLATKDGVTVAREIELRDPVANMACQALKEACIKVNDEAGDGTTSAACIGAAILEAGCRLVAGGMNPIALARGIQRAAQYATDGVWEMARPISTQEQLRQVALIASNGDEEVAENMAEAVMAVGKNGTVSIEDGNSVKIVLDFKDGMEIDRGAASMYFLGDQVERVMDGPLVACIAATLSTVEDVLDICEVSTTLGGRPLLLFAEGIEGEALKTLVINDTNPDVGFKCVAVISPGFHDKKVDYLGDIAALAGADLIDPRAGGSWTTWDSSYFGAFRQANIRSKESTLIAYDEASEVIRDRIAEIQSTARHSTSQYDTDRINERIASLEGGLCIMQIGAATEAELKEKRARVEDALGAVQGALEDGIVPGGGTAYLAASEVLEICECPVDDLEVQAGWGILKQALRRPVMVLAQNAGVNGDYLVEKLADRRDGDHMSWLGWDALTNEFRDFGDDMTVIDPARVAVSVIEAAASAASTLLTSEASISDIK